MDPRILTDRPRHEFYFDAEGCHITELSNSGRDEALSIARARVAPGVTTAWHFLRSITERYVILSGTGLVEVGDGQPTAVGTDDVVIIPPHCRQRITNTGGQDLLFLALCTPRFRTEYFTLCDKSGNGVN
ncbi:MAG: cupin [Porticoccaceae bacterium]|nr:cupin [Porticoccaceae bacterium]